MRYLAPFLLSLFLCFFHSWLSSLQAGETGVEAALEKARQRAGAPPADAKARQEKAREAAQQKAREESSRQAREAAGKAREEAERAAANSGSAQRGDAEVAAQPIVKVFTLKDGRQIHAVLSVELDDTYALKDKDGKLEEVRKADIQSIQAAE